VQLLCLSCVIAGLRLSLHFWYFSTRKCWYCALSVRHGNSTTMRRTVFLYSRNEFHQWDLPFWSIHIGSYKLNVELLDEKVAKIVNAIDMEWSSMFAELMLSHRRLYIHFVMEVIEQHRNDITSYLTGSIKYISNPFLSSVFNMLRCPKTYSVRFRPWNVDEIGERLGGNCVYRKPLLRYVIRPNDLTLFQRQVRVSNNSSRWGWDWVCKIKMRVVDQIS